MHPAAPPWSVAIISSRESVDQLAHCVRAACGAVGDHPAVIDVLVNGNPGLARAAAAAAPGWAMQGCRIQVWNITQGDKAHAWNEYVHRIWTPGTPAFFLDAYAEPRPDAFARLLAAIDDESGVLAATGVPSCGRSAPALRAQMLRDGGIHGNMHAIGAAAMARLRAAGFRLPLGLYRTDSMIGSVLNYNLDPAAHRWEPRRIAVVADATWNVRDAQELSWKKISGQFKRTLRQARGHLENRAAREHLAVRRLAPSAMPRTVSELVLGWMRDKPDELRALFRRHPLSMLAARQFHEPRDWSAASLAPELLTSTESPVAAS